MKSIDTRTFTRPKKKVLRPSIIDCEQFHPISTETIEEKLPDPEPAPEPLPREPLHFDLSQPTSLSYFESMLNSGDNFQNMSPPSLVNSLCSSTFANLMENSFIKNDPVLREIRDKDFTETVMLEDMEAPMFQSISESCCSINSDTPESFLKKVSFNSTLTANTEENVENSGETDNHNLNKTYDNINVDTETKSEDATFCINDQTILGEDPAVSKQVENPAVLNGTYRRTPKRNATFRKADNVNRLSLNLTYEKPLNILNSQDLSKSTENGIDKYTVAKLNVTRNTPNKIINRAGSVENIKRISNIDMNRLSYCVNERLNLDDDFECKEDQVLRDFDGPVENERLSLGSAESLDRTSSLSNSSRGSGKMLNMIESDDIIMDRTRVVSDLMSTPKVNVNMENLWENEYLSPIVSSKNEIKNTAYSRVSHVGNYIKQTDNKDLKIRKHYRLNENLPNVRPLQALPINIKGSCTNISNLKTMSSNFGGSQPRLSKPAKSILRPPSTSNLKTMGSQLKGSYTSLRPISANLPVAPPIGSSNPHVLTRNNAKMINCPKEKIYSAPSIPVSNLPRPTGIPRPSSRIPGLKTATSRPASSRGYNY
ncbi:hypothetical protein GWI33_016071 [Rhynchophorus ferrugineus]|uniref:Uncharacterized protein n=1 Tax=Rhynchophorus ferrugineus TaxID=354439 RepID=A0A834I2F6_RHYFE|nr:hypothetical protein GWI33_016071 [Rhynchophorus ferrugineus]